MHRLLFLLLLMALPLTAVERPHGFVSDGANLLSAQERSSLEGRLRVFAEKGGAELAVVTIPRLDGDPIEGVARRIFDHWGIGKAETDNGVLFLVAVEEKRMRIETGYGSEGLIPDQVAGRIIREVVAPQFKQGAYGQGILLGSEAILKRLEGDELMVKENAKEQLGVIDEGSGIILTILLTLSALAWTKKKALFPLFLFGWATLFSLLAWSLSVLMTSLLVGLFLFMFFGGGGAGGGGGYYYGGGFGPHPGGGFRGGGGGFGGFGGGRGGGGGASGGW